MFGRPRNVYILGAGPAALLAAHAVREVHPRAKVILFSMPDHALGRAKKSELHGCQYLHQYIPDLGLPQEGATVRYEVLGPYEGYREKVYGHNWTGNTSVDEYGPEQTHEAWDLRQAYEILWATFEPFVFPTLVNSAVLRPLLDDRNGIVFSTVPQRSLCINPDHEFKTQDVWAMGSKVHLRVDPSHGAGPGFTPSGMPYRAPDMTVQCNGNRDTAWYRAATVFGHSTLEWPLAKKPPVPGVAAVKKPLSTDCDCWPGMVRLGRYGTWKKGVLVHTAYNEVAEKLR